MLRRFLAFLVVCLASSGLCAAVVEAQDIRARFEIVSPSDTGFLIVLRDANWVKPGMSGIVVDPRQGDELVGSFVVRQIESRSAIVIITGMTTGIRTYHMAVMSVPRKPWYKSSLFWIGSVLGIAAGFFAGRS
jgi:hypothetical protein